jgi:hypothetical protein
MLFPKWLLLTLAVLAALGAAFGFIAYVGNGMAASDLIGLPGREHDIAVAQHRSDLGLLSCVLLQLGVTGALFSYMDRGNGYVGRVFWAVLLSLAMSLTCGFAIVFGTRAFR